MLNQNKESKTEENEQETEEKNDDKKETEENIDFEILNDPIKVKILFNQTCLSLLLLCIMCFWCHGGHTLRKCWKVMEFSHSHKNVLELKFNWKTSVLGCPGIFKYI